MGDALGEPVRIVPYDPTWPARFEEERRIVEEALGPWLVGGVHHIGSTAVPGLAAKPIVDVMAGVESLGEAVEARGAAETAGYVHVPYRADEFHLFCKPSEAQREVHLLLVPHGHPTFGARLAFRDALRADAGLAAEYEELKRELASRHGDDRDAYTDGKADFIARMTRAALEHQRRGPSESAASGL